MWLTLFRGFIPWSPAGRLAWSAREESPMSGLTCPRCMALVATPTPGQECPACQRRGRLQTAPDNRRGAPRDGEYRAQPLDAREELADFDAQTSRSVRQWPDHWRGGRFPPWWVGVLLFLVVETFLGCLTPPGWVILFAPPLFLSWLAARALHEAAKQRAYRAWRETRLQYRAKLAADLPHPTASRQLTPQEELAILDRDWAEESRGYMATTRDGHVILPERKGGYMVALGTLAIVWAVLFPALWSARSREGGGFFETDVGVLALVTVSAAIAILWTERTVRRYRTALAGYQQRRSTIQERIPTGEETGNLPVEAVVHRLAQLEEEWRAEEAHFLTSGNPPSPTRGHFALVLGLGAGIAWCAVTAQLFEPLFSGTNNDDKYVVGACVMFGLGLVAMLLGV
jgi:hypothetical protein